jgi:hypothetical protein
MKNIVAGILVFCVVLATLWAISQYRRGANQDQFPPPANRLEQPELQRAESAQPTAAIPPANEDRVALSPESTDAASASASETDSEPPAPPLAPPPIGEHNDQREGDGPASPNDHNTRPSAGWGLLTDTDETEENRLDDPNAAMVRASTNPKKYRPVPPKIPTQPVAKVNHRETGSIIPAGDLPFSILLETYDNPENARKGVALYEQKGIAAYVVKVDLGSAGIKYRLFGGTFATEKAAQDSINTRSLRGKPIKHTPYTAIIGVFDNRQELAAAINTISTTAAFPYVLGPPTGPFHLVVGAFYTQDGAEAQCRELIASQLNCTVARRSLAKRR